MAQETYRKRQDNTTGTQATYCSEYYDLYYGKDEKGNLLRLISQKHANASASPTIREADASEEPIPYRNYLYIDDPYVTKNSLWDREFGLFAIPVAPRRPMIWIGKDWTIFWREVPSAGKTPPIILPEDSPLDPNSIGKWSPL